MPHNSTPARDSYWLAAATALLTLLSAYILFAPRYLPLVDFPQHVVQLSAWVHYDDPAFGFAPQFEINYRTPYLLSYMLARPFVGLLGAAGALKLVIFVATLALVAALYALSRSVQQDEWLCLLGFPLSFGFCFFGGFLSYLLATPLVICALVLTLRYAQQPTTSRALALSAVLFTTFACHGFAFALCMLACGLLCIGESQASVRRRPLHYWPFLVAGLVALPWFVSFAMSGATAKHETVWARNHVRLEMFPTMFLTCGVNDVLASVFSMAMLALLIGSLGRVARAWQRLSLFVIALVLYFFAPFRVLGVAFVYERFAAMLVPGAILASSPTPALLPRRASRALIAALCLSWLVIVAGRMRAFSEESADFDEAVAQLSCKRLRPLMVSFATQALPNVPAYLHFPAYFQAAHGGFYGFSFARYSSVLVRYRPGVDQGMADGEEWGVAHFNPAKELPHYDCLVARAELDQPPTVLKNAQVEGLIRPSMHAGHFWVYEVVP